jgi:GTP:adenosylcobinamide-phosphate guanylyltransferase
MSDAPWTAILLAGERPGENRFARDNGVAAKALIPVAGEPMLGRVARNLLQCPSIGAVVVLAQDSDGLLVGQLDWMRREPRIRTARSGAGIASSIGAIAGSADAPWPLLVTTADHVLLTPNIVETFVAAATTVDVAVGVVERGIVERAFPETRRTWLQFRGGAYTGANLFALRTEAAHKALGLWASVERDRKNTLRLMLWFGPMLALRALTRTISLDGALQQLGRRAGLSATAVRLPFADAAVDVDKPADLELAETILAARTAAGSTGSG